MEHRTPLGLEIKMYPREARRWFGIKFDKKERDETEAELKARFAHALSVTDFDAIAKVYSVKDLAPTSAPATQKPRAKTARVTPAPTGAMKSDVPLPMFLTTPKK